MKVFLERPGKGLIVSTDLLILGGGRKENPEDA
jgi:hypothetical protein